MAQMKGSPSNAFLDAVRKGDGAVVNQVLENPSMSHVLNARDEKTGQTALHILIGQRNIEWVRVMLAGGANPNLGDKVGDTPLHLAVQMNYIDGAAVLIQMDAKVDAKNNTGETPLIRAVRMRHVEMAKLLLKSGANPDLPDHETGRSARDYAMEDPRGKPLLAVIETGGKDADPAKPAAAPLDFGSDFTPIRP